MLSMNMLLLAGFAAQITWVPAQPGIDVGQPQILAEQGGPPAVAARPKDLIATWLEPAKGPGEPACMVAAVLGRKGAAPAKRVRLSCEPSGELSGATNPVIASRPGGSLIVWGEGASLAGTIVDGRLRAKRSFHVPLGRMPERISVAHDGTRYLVAWSDYEHVRLLRVGNDGALQQRAPEILTERPDRHSIEKASISCARDACALIYRKFLGNSQTTVHGVTLAQGAVSQRFDVGAGPFDIATAHDGAGRPVGLLSNYSHLWATQLPGSTQTPLFSIEARTERIRDLSAATAPHGTLVAWWAEPRGPGTPGVAFAYVPASPDAARPTPVVLEHEAAPVVVTVDEKRFLLLTTRQQPGKPGRAVVARWITVEPKHFARARSERPPVARGRVLTPDGQLAGGARVSFQLQLRGGNQVSSSVLADRQGAFEIPHPEAKDLRPEADVAGCIVWAYREGEVSTRYPVPAGPFDITLQPVATLAGRLVPPSQMRGKARLRVHVLSPDSTWNYRNAMWSHEQEVDLGNPSFDLGEVPSGVALIDAVVPGPAGDLAGGGQVELRPGAAARVSVPLGKRGSLRLRVSGQGAQTRAGEELIVGITPGRGLGAEEMIVDPVIAGEARVWDALVPGEQVVRIATRGGFVMTHRVTIEPGGAATADVAFRADLPPGKVGAVLRLRGDAVEVAAVAPGSPAEAAGIQPGDALLTVDGKQPRTVEEAVTMLGGAPRSKVVVRVRSATGERELRLRRSGP